MNTKAFFSCGGGSNFNLGTGRENQTIIFNTYNIIFGKKIGMEKILSEKYLSEKIC